MSRLQRHDQRIDALLGDTPALRAERREAHTSLFEGLRRLCSVHEAHQVDDPLEPFLGLARDRTGHRDTESFHDLVLFLEPRLVDVAMTRQRAPAVARHRQGRGRGERAKIPLRRGEQLTCDGEERSLVLQGALEGLAIDDPLGAQAGDQARSIDDEHRARHVDSGRTSASASVRFGGEEHRLAVEPAEELDAPLERLPPIIAALLTGALTKHLRHEHSSVGPPSTGAEVL